MGSSTRESQDKNNLIRTTGLSQSNNRKGPNRSGPVGGRSHVSGGGSGSSGKEGARAVFRGLIQREGWRGLYHGCGVNAIKAAPGAAIQFYMYDCLKILTHP